MSPYWGLRDMDKMTACGVQYVEYDDSGSVIKRGVLLRSIRRSAAKKLESTTLRAAFQKMKEQTFKNQNILA